MHVDISAVPSLLIILRCLCLKENAEMCDEILGQYEEKEKKFSSSFCIQLMAPVQNVLRLLF